MAKKTKDDTKDKQIKTSQSKILKNLAQRLSDDYYPNHNYSNKGEDPYKDPEITKINRLIQESANKLSKENESKAEKKAEISENNKPGNIDFNGVSDPKEERTLFVEQIKHLERENTKLKHELEILHEDFQKERAQLKKMVRELKGEIHRTAPLTDSKLFTFSKELRHVASTVQSLSDESKPMFSIESEYENDSDVEPDMLTMPKVSIESPEELVKDTAKQAPKEIRKILNPQVEELNDKLPKKNEEKEDKKTAKLSKNQKVIGGTTLGVLFLLLGLGAVLSNGRVDEKIVEEVVQQQQGEVQGATTPKPTKKPDQRYNQLTFDELEWEIFRDEFLGFQVQYPSNAVDLLHTGNTITFLRYDTYLFKMQRISSEETEEEYIERALKNDLNYQIGEKEIRNNLYPHLTLAEEVEFPGNRFIYSKNDHIYDIWYATESANLKPVDIKIVEKMVDSITFP